MKQIKQWGELLVPEWEYRRREGGKYQAVCWNFEDGYVIFFLDTVKQSPFLYDTKGCVALPNWELCLP